MTLNVIQVSFAIAFSLSSYCYTFQLVLAAHLPIHDQIPLINSFLQPVHH